MKATIITIGDEILIGQIVDTNSVSIAKHLNAAGIVVGRKIPFDDGQGALGHQGMSDGGRQKFRFAGSRGTHEDECEDPMLSKEGA